MLTQEEILKEAGLRITQQRLQIMDYLSSQKRPVVLQDLNKEFGSKINRITLYRILNDFERVKMVKLFFAHDGQKLIEWIGAVTEASIAHNSHLHFQCKMCEQVFCLDDVEVKNLPQGFDLSSEQSVLVGKCAVCE